MAVVDTAPITQNTVVKVQPARSDKDEKASADLLARFLDRSGYKEEDVLSYNSRTKQFVTSNGGKYVMQSKKIRRLSGPQFPNEVEDEE